MGYFRDTYGIIMTKPFTHWSLLLGKRLPLHRNGMIHRVKPSPFWPRLLKSIQLRFVSFTPPGGEVISQLIIVDHLIYMYICVYIHIHTIYIYIYYIIYNYTLYNLISLRSSPKNAEGRHSTTMDHGDHHGGFASRDRTRNRPSARWGSAPNADGLPRGNTWQSLRYVEVINCLNDLKRSWKIQIMKVHVATCDFVNLQDSPRCLERQKTTCRTKKYRHVGNTRVFFQRMFSHN